MAVGAIDGSDFAVEYERRARELDRLSYTQRVPGMDRAEVRAELEQALWKAFETYDPAAGTTLGQWWWAVWVRKKADLIESFFAQKNPRPNVFDPSVLEGMIDELLDTMAPLLTLQDLCPSSDVTERAVWALLCHGFSGVEIRKVLKLSVRRFYAIMDGWRTPEVRAILT